MDSIFSSLNDKQAEAVRATEGRVRIVATENPLSDATWPDYSMLYQSHKTWKEKFIKKYLQ